MKNLILSLIAVLALSGAAQANHVFGGLRYDDGLIISVGSVNHLAGGLSVINFADVGTYSSAGSELVMIGKLAGTPFYAGVLGGPNLDLGNGETKSLATYVTGAGGFIFGWQSEGKLGIVGKVKYKFTLKETVSYENGVNFGLALTYLF